ncbi:MAG: GpE family phage tail protein [Bacillota bacterium]
MANIAAVFHWPPDVMDRMPLPELMRWHSLALDRHRVMNGVE